MTPEPDDERGFLTDPAHGSILMAGSAAQGRAHASRALLGRKEVR